MPRQKKGSRKTNKKRLSGNDGEDLLKMIGLSSNPDKKYMTNESINLLEEIGRCYTETGRHTGETEGDNLLMLIGASSADQAVKAVNCAPDPSSIVGKQPAIWCVRSRPMMMILFIRFLLFMIVVVQFNPSGTSTEWISSLSIQFVSVYCLAQVQADALARRKQTEEQDNGGYPQGIR